MDNLDRAARLEAVAFAYRSQATLFTGRRRFWRLDRADALMQMAWQLIT